jgi:hypothetical protein
MARGRLKTELNARKDRVSGVLDGMAETVRRAGEPLRDRSAALGGYADQAADGLKRIADGLRERDVAELASDVEALARRHPGAFVATGFAAGLLAARFLRTSAEHPELGGSAGAGRPATEMGRGLAEASRAGRRPGLSPSETMKAPRRAEGERHG